MKSETWYLSPSFSKHTIILCFLQTSLFIVIFSGFDGSANLCARIVVAGLISARAPFDVMCLSCPSMSTVELERSMMLATVTLFSPRTC